MIWAIISAVRVFRVPKPPCNRRTSQLLFSFIRSVKFSACTWLYNQFFSIIQGLPTIYVKVDLEAISSLTKCLLVSHG